MKWVYISLVVLIIVVVIIISYTKENYGAVEFTANPGNVEDNPYSNTKFNEMDSQGQIVKIPAINGDNIASDQLQIVDNSKLDKIFNDTASSIIGKAIISNLPSPSTIPQGTNQDTKYIDQTEVSRITNLFITTINSGTGKTFTVTDTGTVGLNMVGTPDQLTKTYTLPIFLFDGGDFYTRRVILTVTLNLFKNSYGNAVVTNVQTPQDEQTIPVAPILPYATIYPKLNKVDDAFYYPIPDDNGILFTADDLAKAQAEQAVDQQLAVAYQCYGVPTSEQIGTQAECTLFGGVWDRPVQTDAECPFYQANKNYTNDYGGNNNGYCQMPAGMQIIGYRYYSKDPLNAPICYNCTSNLLGQGTTGNCCNNQPNFKSPDYQFAGDGVERTNAVSELAMQNLSVS